MARRKEAAPLVADLAHWMRARLSRHAPVAKAMDTLLKRREGFTRFLEEGRVADTPRSQLAMLLPWNWATASTPAEGA